jgi:hypothetical protein
MATTTTLMADVRLIGGALEEDSIADSIELSSGIIRAQSQYESLQYWEEAFVPRLPWRKPTNDELKSLFGSVEQLRPGAWVQVLAFPEPVYAAFENIRAVSLKAASEQELNALRSTTECQEAVTMALKYASTLVCPATKLGQGNVYFNLPGLPTTSNYKDPVLLGIHTDTMCSIPIKYRLFSPNRLCLNLGLCDRYLLFVNLGLSRIKSLLQEKNVSYQETPGTSPLLAFRTAFMSTFCTYPVVKVRIKPRQGYIAPTENVLHDGCSVGQAAFDIPFHAHGHFRPVLD